jgi:arylformamidase
MTMAALWPHYAADLPDKVVQGGLAISGLYDLLPLMHTNVNDDLHLTEDSANYCSPARMSPPTDAPLYTCVGGLESDEFKRQNRLIGEKWRAVFKKDVPAPAFNHFTVVEELVNPDGAMLATALRMMQL